MQSWLQRGAHALPSRLHQQLSVGTKVQAKVGAGLKLTADILGQ